jgi:hypothetical protein
MLLRHQGLERLGMASPSGGGDDRLLRCSRSRSETIRGCSASSQRTTSCVIVSPASSSRAGSPTVTRRPRPAGSGRLISRAVDGIGAGERHRRRRGPGRLGWRPLRRRDLRPGDWQRGRDLVEQALRHSGVNLEVSADAHIRGGRQVHDVVAGERVSCESAQPPRELLQFDHLQPHPRIADDPP